jgi:hypothetical protein
MTDHKEGGSKWLEYIHVRTYLETGRTRQWQISTIRNYRAPEPLDHQARTRPQYLMHSIDQQQRYQAVAK